MCPAVRVWEEGTTVEPGGSTLGRCGGSGGGDFLENYLFAAYLSMVGITVIGERSDTVSGFVP